MAGKRFNILCVINYITQRKSVFHISWYYFYALIPNNHTACSRGTKRHRGKQHEYSNFHSNILVCCMATILILQKIFVKLKVRLQKVRYHQAKPLMFKKMTSIEELHSHSRIGFLCLECLWMSINKKAIVGKNRP